ncbi:hypothetical protein ACK38U_01740 [Aeromonas veronii]
MINYWAGSFSFSPQVFFIFGGGLQLLQPDRIGPPLSGLFYARFLWEAGVGEEKRKKPAFLQAFLLLDHQWIILVPVLGQSLSPRFG